MLTCEQLAKCQASTTGVLLRISRTILVDKIKRLTLFPWCGFVPRQRQNTNRPCHTDTATKDPKPTNEQNITTPMFPAILNIVELAN